MIGTITSAATGSAHHQPSTAFRTNPPNKIADKYVQKSVCRESPSMAALPIPAATRRFAFAKSGITMTDRAAMMIPAILRSGASCRMSVEATCSCRDGSQPPDKCHTGRDLERAQTKPTRETDPAIRPATIETRPSNRSIALCLVSRDHEHRPLGKSDHLFGNGTEHKMTPPR